MVPGHGQYLWITTDEFVQRQKGSPVFGVCTGLIKLQNRAKQSAELVSLQFACHRIYIWERFKYIFHVNSDYYCT